MVTVENFRIAGKYVVRSIEFEIWVRNMIALRGRRDRILEVIRSYPGAFFFLKVLILRSLSEGKNALGGKDICRGVERILST